MYLKNMWNGLFIPMAYSYAKQCSYKSAAPPTGINRKPVSGREFPAEIVPLELIKSQGTQLKVLETHFIFLSSSLNILDKLARRGIFFSYKD